MVLLVEDNPTDVYVIREVLGQCGLKFRLSIAMDGPDALRLLREVEEDDSAPCPGLVLLDLNVPKISGVEILRQIRSSRRCKRIPVVVVTSSGALSDRATAQSLGADGYFQKPTSLESYMQLADVIRQVLPPAEGSRS
jgi:two-component system, chemotaxis family, response regulator Rcp1